MLRKEMAFQRAFVNAGPDLFSVTSPQPMIPQRMLFMPRDWNANPRPNQSETLTARRATATVLQTAHFEASSLAEASAAFAPRYPGNLDPNQPFVVKVHGDVQTPESIVITDEDYIQFVLRMSDKEPYNPVPLTYRFFFTKWPTLFVGYSLLDYNLRLLFKTLRWKIDPSVVPDTYSVDLSPDPLIVDVYYNRQRYINFITQDVWTFVPSLYHMVTGEEMPKQC